MTAAAPAIDDLLAAPRRVISPWVVAAVVVIPTFMEVLDTTIANVALRYIAGGLSAPVTDSEWVITSYLAANAIILPISGWLAARLGRRNYFLLSIALFTLASAAVRRCPVAGDPHRRSRLAGPCRRGASAFEPGDSARRVSPREAGGGADNFRRGGAAGAGRRADARRIHHRQLRLAMDFLSESAGRIIRVAPLPNVRHRSRLSHRPAGRAAKAEERVRFGRAVSARGGDGLLGNPAHQGAGVGLVWRSFLAHSDAGVDFRRVADLPGLCASCASRIR